MTKLSKPISRKTGTPAGSYGRDSNRDLVVTLAPGSLGRDMISLRPSTTRREKTILVSDLWSHMQRCEANRVWSEKMAARKAKKAAAKEAASAKRATAKLHREVHAEGNA